MAMEIPLSEIKPHFTVPFNSLANPSLECPRYQQLIHFLRLSPHLEGGYFRETDRDRDQIVCPGDKRPGSIPTSGTCHDIRSLSTTRLYLLTPPSPIQAFHRTRSRVVHTLHRGRAIYVILKSGGRQKESDRVQVESFVVGQDLGNGEKVQWVVEGGCYKASFLIPDGDTDGNSSGLLISETVMPGFEYRDHEFLQAHDLNRMVDPTASKQMAWLLRENFTQGSDFP